MESLGKLFDRMMSHYEDHPISAHATESWIEGERKVSKLLHTYSRDNALKKIGVYSRFPEKREMSGNMGNIETLGDLEVFLCLKRADLLQYYDKWKSLKLGFKNKGFSREL